MIAPTQNQSNRNQQNSTANHKAVVSAEHTFRSIFPQNLSRKGNIPVRKINLPTMDEIRHPKEGRK